MMVMQNVADGRCEKMVLTFITISSFFFFSMSMESVEWLCASNAGDVMGLVPEKITE